MNMSNSSQSKQDMQRKMQIQMIQSESSKRRGSG